MELPLDRPLSYFKTGPLFATCLPLLTTLLGFNLDS